jgi:hypothetical protein
MAGTALTTTGRVGINQAAPTAALDVSGSTVMNSGATTNTALTTTGRVGINIAAPTVPLDVSGSARLNAGSTTNTALTTTGWVGINQSSPSFPLDVSGSARLNAGSTTNTALTTTGWVGINQSSPAFPLDVTGSARLNAGSTTNTALTTTGWVGINQSSPAFPLDVTGSARITGNLSMSSSGRINNLVDPSSSQDAATKSYVDTQVSTASTAATSAQTTANSAVTKADSAQTKANSAYDAATAAQTKADSAATAATAAQTTANSVSTAIQGNGATASAQYLYPASGNVASILTNGTHRLYVTTDGKIGIGTTSPDAKLDIDNGNIRVSSTGTSSILIRGSTNSTIKPEFGLGTYDNISYVWNYKDTPMHFGTNGTERMRITENGRVGIGTDSPSCPLHVKGSDSNTITGTTRFWDKDGNTGLWGPTIAIAFITENSIWNKGTYIWVTSDQRIKKNITTLNADKMMTIFRKMRPISFDFIDPIKNNNKKHFGFIAQEVNEVLPEGITLNTDVIPNNMMKADIAKPSETDQEEPHITLKPTDTDITLQYLLLTTDTPLIFDISNSYSSKDIYKFKIYGGEKWAKELDIYIRSDYNVTDDKYTYVIGMKKEAYDVIITEPTLFVYGQYVYDLHILEHDTIYTVATAALQEVDRQQQADKARIAELENHVSKLETTVATQQSLINDILERLKALEKA